MPRCSGGSLRSRKGVQWIEGPRTRSPEEWHPRPPRRGRPPRPTGPGFRGRRQRPYWSPHRDGGRVRGRGRGHVPAPPREPDGRGVRVGGALLRIGVTILPGSNCDRDALYAIELAGAEPVELWHADASLKGVDAVVVPGGFSYGDYLRPGAIARFTKVMGSLEEFAKSGGPILGICNGFQVLTEAHLLPGALLRNTGMRFVCTRTPVRFESVDTPWTALYEPGQEILLPVAHNEGNYFADERTLRELEVEGRVVLRYLDNPNGSLNDIAGICNESRNVVGLMPHPERVSDPILGSDAGLKVFESVLRFAGVGV